jgi:hypothetical protein
VAQLIETLRYEPEVRGFDGDIQIFIDLILQSLTEMTTRDLPWGVKAAGVQS